MKMKKEKYTVLDLFSGCGGLSLGFEMEGFHVVGGIDNWQDAINTFEYNHKNSKGICADVKDLTGEDIKKKLNIDSVDIIVGGPPCQSFSLAGNRNACDYRNDLPFEFLRIVKDLKPKFVLIENVLGILSMNKGVVKNAIVDELKTMGYNVDVKALFAHNFGVPQKRRRVFFFANRINEEVIFPEYTHSEDDQNKKKKYVTVREAIDDLYALETKEDELIEYKIDSSNDYQNVMRKGSKNILNHQENNHTEKTKEVISFVPEGGNWRDLPEEHQNIRSFSNTWRRLDGYKPSVTIDTGHRHHFHYALNRVPTVRESARIQSFPDKFKFLGSKTSQFKQVGNAVPPFFARAFAKEIKKILKKHDK